MRFGAPAARVELRTTGADGFEHELAVGLEPGAAKRITVDGQPVERLAEHPARPLVCVFIPDRLELVKGAPSLRRAHIDAVVAALWPARAATRRAYSSALAQRNALLARVRAGRADRRSLAAWDLELATHGVALRDDRAAAIALLEDRFAAARGRARTRRAAPSCAIARAPTRRRRPSWRPSSPSASTPTSSVASPPTGRTATTSALAAAIGPRAARLRIAGRAAPGPAVAAAGRARRAARTSAAPRRCCCSTT